ncbi:MAG: branched-chain amino acid ABC transporter permease [Akkermansiaceae bacterium]|jgi:branched-chain amino acid transport system permease protein|nr:branched-chain amino acid ABC transporter permease [Akkermansiaceae bacterium]
MKLLLLATLNGVTLAALYFIAASGFTIIFGMMRVVNMAHGSLYLVGAYLGHDVASASGNWFLALAGGAIGAALIGALTHALFLDRYQGQDLRQALVTIGLSIIAADLMLARYGGLSYQFDVPSFLYGSTPMPIIGGYPTFRLALIGFAFAVYAVLWLVVQRTRFGIMIRAGVDDRVMLSALGVNVPLVSTLVFALGACLVGLAGVIGGSALSIAPGEDGRYLLSSLVVVIVGGMGSLGGAAIGALLIGLAEQIGLAYFPTYSIIVSFVIMVAVLAVRPYGLLGRPA